MPYTATSLILPVNQNFATSISGGRWLHTMVGTGAGTTSGVMIFSNSTVYLVTFSSGMLPSTSSPAARTWTFSAVRKNDSTTLDLGATITRNIIFPALATTSSAPPDTTAPTVSIEHPVAANTYAGTIPVIYSIEDQSPITTVQLIITTTGAAISSSGLIWPTTNEFVTTTSMNGNVNLAIRAVDSATNEATVSVDIIVNNSVSSTGTTTLSRRAAIIDRVPDGRVVVALWAQVPPPAQVQFARPGLVSKWTLASTQQNDALAAGQIAERIRVLPVAGMTDQQILDMIQVEWAIFNDSVDELGIWPQINKTWSGQAWTT